jgi:hypothetical protein
MRRGCLRPGKAPSAATGCTRGRRRGGGARRGPCAGAPLASVRNPGIALLTKRTCSAWLACTTTLLQRLAGRMLLLNARCCERACIVSGRAAAMRWGCSRGRWRAGLCVAWAVDLATARVGVQLVRT